MSLSYKWRGRADPMHAAEAAYLIFLSSLQGDDEVNIDILTFYEPFGEFCIINSDNTLQY